MSDQDSDNGYLACWKITNCQKTSICPAVQNPDVPCWEIASQLGDYRSRLKVCEDCLVYLVMQNKAVFSTEEIQEVLKQRGLCPLSTCTESFSRRAAEG